MLLATEFVELLSIIINEIQQYNISCEGCSNFILESARMLIEEMEIQTEEEEELVIDEICMLLLVDPAIKRQHNQHQLDQLMDDFIIQIKRRKRK